MTKDEALNAALDALLVYRYGSCLPLQKDMGAEAIKAIRQALLDRDKLLEICKEIVSDAEEHEFDDGLGVAISMDLYSRLASAVETDEPDTGIDRGAWSDVPDATKWLDDLRGDQND